MNDRLAGFEEQSHTADLEIRVWGEDLDSLFSAAADGMFHLSGIEDRTILLDSISKRYSACGARIGCLISKNHEVKH